MRSYDSIPTLASVLEALLRREAWPEILLVSHPASASPCDSGKSWWSLDLEETCMSHVSSAQESLEQVGIALECAVSKSNSTLSLYKS